MTVKHFSVEYNKVNGQGTYSPGDVLSGEVIVETSKEIKVQCFLVKAKGKAKVIWTEQDRQTTVVHSNKKKYFYFEHIILQDKNKGDGSEVMGAGRNKYPFSFVIPNTDMPSSYKGKFGAITYSLRAQLTQSIWLVHKTKMEFPFLTKAEFPFASKSDMIIIGLKEQQYVTRISFYGSGKITINVTSERMGLKQGEMMGISAQVFNDSARAVTPKFYLCEKQTFVAQSKKAEHTNDTLFAIGESVPAESSQTITKVLNIPTQIHPTFFNCCMMKLEYGIKVFVKTAPHSGCLKRKRQEEGEGGGVKASWLFHKLMRVVLDVPLVKNPEIKLPLVILQGLPKPHLQKQKRSIWFKKL